MSCCVHAQVRGLGLLVGIQLDFMAGPVVEAARAAGVLVITAGELQLQTQLASKSRLS